MESSPSATYKKSVNDFYQSAAYSYAYMGAWLSPPTEPKPAARTKKVRRLKVADAPRNEQKLTVLPSN